MNAVERTCRLAIVLGAVAMGCGGDDDDGKGTMDGGTLMDASTDASSDSARPIITESTCNSKKRPTGDKCGGSHCTETEAQLRAGTQTSAVCGADIAVTGFCSLDNVDKVGVCARGALGAESQTRTCSLAALPNLAPACVECYVQSAVCAGQQCFEFCATGDSVACDQCRIDKGCIDSFYRCAGYKLPTY